MSPDQSPATGEMSCYEPGDPSQSYAYFAKFTRQDYII